MTEEMQQPATVWLWNGIVLLSPLSLFSSLGIGVDFDIASRQDRAGWNHVIG